MARLQFGRLTEAWTGEAADFTPLLAEQLDELGAAIGLDLAAVGEAEVQTAGGRRIDIVAQGSDGTEFVIENQYGTGDHDHLTRGLAYAVARRARGLIVVAETHRAEFRAVCEYLNDLAELDLERGIALWLVEARAVRIEESPWAPLFAVVTEPNAFTASVEQAKQSSATTTSRKEFLAGISSGEVKTAIVQVLDRWASLGHPAQFWSTRVGLLARGPSMKGLRSVVTLHADGRLMIPFSAYAGVNSGNKIEALSSQEFLEETRMTFGLKDSAQLASTKQGWLTPETAEPTLNFLNRVADEYAAVMPVTAD